MWIGNAGVRYGMTDTTRQHALRFWHLVDEILNAVLFLLIGLEIVAVSLAWEALRLGLMMIPLVLLARMVSVGLSLRIAQPLSRPKRGVLAVMTWGGLRGAISVALALSLPDNADRNLILTVTYVIVVVHDRRPGAHRRPAGAMAPGQGGDPGHGPADAGLGRACSGPPAAARPRPLARTPDRCRSSCAATASRSCAR